jgi:glycolate oxidase
VRVAADEAERALLWKGRKTAFGAIARIKPNYYLHDTVVPRRVLPKVLEQVYAIAAAHDLLVLNVFHAGDGNLHPLLVFDKREPGTMERVHAAGDEIVRASVAAGGVLSGEHGIGLEKRDLMPLMFAPPDLAAQAALRAAFDPAGLANPGKVLPSGSVCGDVSHVPEGAWI